MVDFRDFTPSFERNIAPITDKLKTILPDHKSALLEIGSGSGQHASHLASVFPYIEIQPSEYSSNSLPSINAWAEHLKVSNLRLAITLDVMNPQWNVQDNYFSALTAFNVIHYSPWALTETLFAHASRYLTKDAKIIFYGPYKIDGAHTSESNVEFEIWLKDKDETFGVRDIGEVQEAASRHGFTLETLHPMPANNFMPVFCRS